MILKLCFRNLDAKERIDWLVGWLTQKPEESLQGADCQQAILLRVWRRSGRIEQDFSYTQA